VGRFRNSTRERSTRPVPIEYTDAGSTDVATRYNDTDEASKTEGEGKKNTNKNTSSLVMVFVPKYASSLVPATMMTWMDEPWPGGAERWRMRCARVEEVKLVLVPNQLPTRRETNWPPSFHAPLLGRRPSDRSSTCRRPARSRHRD
jgi:hypothetical protein